MFIARKGKIGMLLAGGLVAMLASGPAWAAEEEMKDPSRVGRDTSRLCNGTSSDGFSVFQICNGPTLTAVPCGQGQLTQNCAPQSATCNNGQGVPEYDWYCGSIGNGQEMHSPPPPDPKDEIHKAHERLNHESDLSNHDVIAKIGADASNAGGGQASLSEAAGEVGHAGANQAATIGALYCAQGAVEQAANLADDASNSFGVCKQYFGAAQVLSAGKGSYAAHDSTINGDFAKTVLDKFEKNFGIAGDDYMGRMLGAKGSIDELSDMTKDKLKAEELAQAYADAKTQGGDAKLEAAEGGAGAKKLGIRAALKAALADAAGKDAKEAARRPAAAAARAEGPRLKNLEPLREGLLAEADARNRATQAKVPELTLFDVVHLKYGELAKRHDF